ncbi:unnamed protein product [Mytilus coruscus]|uniref:Uncharacterized protein n=1 Tax=Mytilus coruscus TaxID=42192 RepID=A0A6J8B2L6_MYTCO|nr:unnamed protein product [Mytilus coruscus]
MLKRLGMIVGTIVGNMDRPNIKLVVSTRPAWCGGTASKGSPGDPTVINLSSVVCAPYSQPKCDGYRVRQHVKCHEKYTNLVTARNNLCVRLRGKTTYQKRDQSLLRQPGSSQNSLRPACRISQTCGVEPRTPSPKRQLLNEEPPPEVIIDLEPQEPSVSSSNLNSTLFNQEPSPLVSIETTIDHQEHTEHILDSSVTGTITPCTPILEITSLNTQKYTEKPITTNKEVPLDLSMKTTNKLNIKPVEIPTKSLTPIIDCLISKIIWNKQPLSLEKDNHEHLCLDPGWNYPRNERSMDFRPANTITNRRDSAHKPVLENEEMPKEGILSLWAVKKAWEFVLEEMNLHSSAYCEYCEEFMLKQEQYGPPVLINIVYQDGVRASNIGAIFYCGKGLGAAITGTDVLEDPGNDWLEGPGTDGLNGTDNNVFDGTDINVFDGPSTDVLEGPDNDVFDGPSTDCWKVLIVMCLMVLVLIVGRSRKVQYF